MRWRRQRGEGPIELVLLLGVIIAIILALVPWFVNPSGVLSADELLRQLGNYGYTAYASPAGDFYVNDLLPNSDSAYDIGALGNEFKEGRFDNLILTGTNPIELAGAGKIWIEFRPDIDPTKLSVNAKPTQVTRDIYLGSSLPVGGADEELFLSTCIPSRWDGKSDIHVHIHAWLDTAQDEEADAVKLQLDWGAIGGGDVVPSSSNTEIDEVVTGIIAQYTVIIFEFILDYDTAPANPVKADDTLFLHLTRIASSHEAAGELVVYKFGVIYQFDKIGGSTP